MHGHQLCWLFSSCPLLDPILGFRLGRKEGMQVAPIVCLLLEFVVAALYVCEQSEIVLTAQLRWCYGST
jgi:hypothetical protein